MMSSAKVATMAHNYQGIYPVLYAFFDQSGELHEPSMRAQVDHCVLAGAHGICVLGLVTEVNRISPGQRLELVEMVGKLIGGRVPYAVTVGEPTVGEQVAFCEAAKKAGASWCILQPPPGHGHSEPDLIRFFSDVASSVSLDIGIQNNPVNLASSLSVSGLVKAVTTNDNIRLLKAEGWSVDIARVVHELAGRVDCFGGHGGIEFLSLLRSGAAGLIPAPDCLALQVRIYELFRQGDAEALAHAEAIHRDLLPLIVFMTRNIPGLVYYGKRLFAAQAGIETLYDLPGGVTPTEFGMSETNRLLENVRSAEARYLGPPV